MFNATSLRFRRALIVSVGIAGLLAGAATNTFEPRLAGHGGGGGKASGSFAGHNPVMVVDQNGDGLPNFGDTITFNVSTSNASWPSVQLDCFQNGGLVMTAVRGYYATYMWTDNVVLKGGYWSAGAADCTATLYNQNKNGSTTTLATLSFHVNA